MLPRDEAEHLRRVLRVGVGDTVSVFDGRGHEYSPASRARSATCGTADFTFEPAAEPSVPMTLVQAGLKADKMDEIVRDAVMLGVAAIQPVVTKRTETTVAMLLGRRGWIAGSGSRLAKQSRRAVLPDIGCRSRLRRTRRPAGRAAADAGQAGRHQRQHRRTTVGVQGSPFHRTLRCSSDRKADGPTRSSRRRAHTGCGS